MTVSNQILSHNVLKLKITFVVFPSSIEMIEEKPIIVDIVGNEKYNGEHYVRVVVIYSLARFSVFSLTEDISISLRAYFYLQYTHRETRAINPTEAGHEARG